MKSLLTLATLLTATVVAHTQPAAPFGPPPTFKVVNKIDKMKSEIFFLETVVKLVPQNVQRVVIVNGKQETITETRFVPVMEHQISLFNVANSRAITTDGKQLPIEEVWNRLKKDAVVAVSADGNTPAQAFLRVLNPEVIVLIPGPPTPAKKLP